MAICNKPILIYCSGKSRRLDTIAKDCGLELGIQLPSPTLYFWPFFVDQNWKAPNRTQYVQSIQSIKPTMATVIDIESHNLFKDALSWAEDISSFVEYIIMIPKVSGIIQDIPLSINGTQVILGYSVPTKYGTTSTPLWEFRDRRVHLLGGSPKKQVELWRYLDVFSCDGNAMRYAAMKFGHFWNGSKWEYIGSNDRDKIYEAFKISCENIVRMWNTL